MAREHEREHVNAQDLALYFAVVLALSLVEFVVYYGNPAVLAKLAWIPVGTARTVRMPRVVSGLATASYRSDGREVLSLDRVAIPPSISGTDTVGEWSGTAGWLRLTTLWFGWNRTLGVARLRARVEGDVVRLDARVYPVPMTMVLWVSVLPFGFPGGIEDKVLVLIGLFVFSILLSWYMTTRRIRDDVDGALLQVASAIEGGSR